MHKTFIIIIFVLISGRLFAQSDFQSFINKYEKDLNARTEECEKYFGQEPNKTDLEENLFEVFLKSKNFVVIMLKYQEFDAHNLQRKTLTTYNWDGQQISTFEYDYSMSGDFVGEATVCQIDNNNIITCKKYRGEATLTPNSGNEDDPQGYQYQTTKDEMTEEKYELTDDGYFERIAEPENGQ